MPPNPSSLHAKLNHLDTPKAESLVYMANILSYMVDRECSTLRSFGFKILVDQDIGGESYSWAARIIGPSGMFYRVEVFYTDLYWILRFTSQDIVFYLPGPDCPSNAAYVSQLIEGHLNALHADKLMSFFPRFNP